jgi:cobalt/nickel transport system permease protein
MAAEPKIVAAFLTVVAIALTPREAIWAFGVYAVLLVALVRIARIPYGFVMTRLVAVAPFVVFALFIPFVAGGERTEMIGVSVSIEGLWGAWNIYAKALLGASISILLTATTEVSDVVRGLGVLRVPAVLTSIALFMVRYLELIVDELGRMRVAMSARGYDPRWLSQVRPIANSAGALFVRSYERGERVHAAMLSRGFSGTMPALRHPPAAATDWYAVILVTGAFWVIAVAAMVVT